jgi:copper chaperone CopZ/uncharacterized membrane protein YphA (DoxX/SURF4 family)
MQHPKGQEMIHTYAINGMHCQSCIGKVKAALESLEKVRRADVSLTPAQAVVDMQTHVEDSEIDVAIRRAGDYSLGHNTGPANVLTSEVAPATYFPLLLILGYLTAAAAWSYWSGGFDLSDGMATFMGGFFLVFSFFKFLDLRGFAQSFSSYDTIASRWTGYGFAYPFVELILGIAYVTGLNPTLTNVVTLVVMSVSTIGVVQSLLQKRTIQCACLGTVFNLPMSKVTLIEDLLMIVMAAAMLALRTT